MAMVFIIVAGKTTPAASAKNGPGKPTMIRAEPRKIIPEINVPINVNASETANGLPNFLTRENSKNIIKAEKNLSIIFGINPPGKVVVNPEITPVTPPRRTAFFKPGNKNIPRNIIINIRSGFIPKMMPGINACSTAPIPTNKDSDTNVFVFNSHLSSSHLYSTIASPIVHSLPIAKSLVRVYHPL